MWTQGKKLDNNRYKIEETLGSGGFGVTYKAWDLRIGDDFPVVIKVPNLSAHNKKNRSQLIDLFKKKAKLLAAVSRTPHPHIVRITDRFEEEGIPCLVMDFVSGTNLQDLVEEKERLSEEKAIAYMKDIGSALEFCHKKGIIHRDIKPANIMVRDDDERVMLIDFGIARETGGETMTTSFTRLSDGLKQAIIATMQPDPENRPQSVKAWLELLPIVTVSSPAPQIPISAISTTPFPAPQTTISPVSPAPTQASTVSPASENTSPSAKDWFDRGVKKKEEGDYEGAIEDFTQAILLDPNYAEAYLCRGYIRKGLKDYKGVIEDVNEAIRLAPNDETAFELQAGFLNYLNDEVGIEDVNEVIRLKPNCALAYFWRGYIRNELKDYKGAIEDVNEVIRLKPNCALAYFWRGYIRNELKDYKGVIEDVNEAIRLAPNDEKAFELQAGFLNYLNDNDEVGIEDVNEVIRLKPNCALAYFWRGYIRNELKDYKGAIEDVNEVIRLKPNCALAYFWRGYIRNELKDYKGVIEDVNEAIRLAPNDEKAFELQDYVHDYLKDDEVGIEDVNEVIRLKPNCALAYCWRGYIRNELKDYEGAIKDLTQAIRLNPNCALAYYGRGIAYEQQGKKRQALENFRQVAEIGSGSLYETALNHVEEIVGIDYTRLRDLLAAGEWYSANRETKRVMLSVVNREEEGWLRQMDIHEFPKTDLHTIDNLWVKYSSGHFGFSVQKRIWESLGGTTERWDGEIWDKFGDRVGWKRGEYEWITSIYMLFDHGEPIAGSIPYIPYFCDRYVGDIGNIAGGFVTFFYLMFDNIL